MNDWRNTTPNPAQAPLVTEQPERSGFDIPLIISSALMIAIAIRALLS